MTFKRMPLPECTWGQASQVIGVCSDWIKVCAHLPNTRKTNEQGMHHRIN